LALHGVVWQLWQNRQPAPLPEIVPPKVIEVALVTPPPPPKSAPQPVPPQPAALPAQPKKAEPKPAKLEEKKTEAKKIEPKKPEAKPKPAEIPKPTPPRPQRRPKPAALSEPEPEPAALPAKAETPVERHREETAPAHAEKPAVTHAEPAKAPPVPVTEASYRAPGLHNPPTRYPPVALQRHWEGTVLLLVQVLPDGSAGSVSVKSGSGHDLLDEAAVQQVKNWHFVPARRGDQAVAGSVTVPIKFTLPD
jgi:protein TonB